MVPSFLHRQVASILNASEDPSRLQIIVAPTSGAALALRTAVARMDVPLVNVEAVTPSGLALHIWRSMRPFETGRLVTRDTMTLVLATSVAALESRDADLFRSSLSRVAAGIEADRMAGRDAAWARSTARSAIQRAYASLFEEYEAYLREEGLVDMADIHRDCGALVQDFCKERDLDAILVCCETPILPIQQPLLDTLGTAARTCAILGNPDLIDDLEGPWASRVLNSWSVAEPSPEAVQWPRKVLQAATRREEVWMILSHIVDRRIPFDDVELVVSSRETYVPLIDAACRRLGIPTTLATEEGDRLTGLRIVIADYLKWIASGYQSRHLADVLRNPRFRQSDDQSPSPYKLATLLEHFQLTPAMLSRPDLDRILDEGAERKRISKSDVRQLVSWMRAFRTCVPDGSLSPPAMGALLSRFLETHVDREGWSPAGASTETRFVEQMLEPLAKAHTGRVDASWLASFLLDTLNEQTASQDFGNGLHVSSWDEAGYGPRAHAWVLGLDDQASGNQSADDMTHVAGLEASRPPGHGRSIPARRRLQDLILRFGDRLVAATPAWDIRASRSLFPGSALVDAARIEEIKAVRRERRLDAADLARLTPEAMKGRFAGVQKGLEAQCRRNEEGWTEYDGKTFPEKGALELRLSPSRMEQYLACPYRYFLSSVLGLEGGPQEGEDWMDRAAEGNVLHDLFEEHTRGRVAGESGVSLEDENVMLDKLREALERQAARSGADPDAVLEARFRELAHGVRRYFERERRLADERRPKYAEYSFSDREGADAPAARYQGRDGSILLTGRVDRIDATQSDQWVIVDYKTGKPEGFVPQKLLKLDDKLQWALYAWAIGQISGKEVAASEYVFTSREGAGWTSSVASPAGEQVAPLFDSVLRRIRTGHFIPAPDENTTCTWCDFKAVCGDLTQRKAAIRAKFAEADPDETQAFEGWAMRDKNLSSS